MNYIKIFQNAQGLSVSVGNNYSEYQLMSIFLDNFHQGGKHYFQIVSHQAELSRKGKFNDKKPLSISSLHTDYLNIDSSSGCGKNSERENTAQTRCTFCGGANHSAVFFPKRSGSKRKKIMRPEIETPDVWNACLGNVLFADPKII